jgi:hypothetical protein
LISSYSLSQNFDRHVLLFWTVAVPIYRSAVAMENAWRWWPALLFWLGILAKALGLVAVVVAVVVAVAMIPVHFWLCAAGLVVGAYVTYPRTAVR